MFDHFPQIGRGNCGNCYFKYGKRCPCAFWSPGAGAAAGCCWVYAYGRTLCFFFVLVTAGCRCPHVVMVCGIGLVQGAAHRCSPGVAGSALSIPSPHPTTEEPTPTEVLCRVGPGRRPGHPQRSRSHGVPPAERGKQEGRWPNAEKARFGASVWVAFGADGVKTSPKPG